MSAEEKLLKKIASKEKSKWIEKAEWRVANEEWLDKSAKIALTILRTIRDKKITQKELAERMSISPQQINKIVKGSENLTLETISKFEKVLGITLIEVPQFQTEIQTQSNDAGGLQMQQAIDVSNISFSYDQMKEPISCSNETCKIYKLDAA